MPAQRKLLAMVEPPKRISEMSPEEIDRFVDQLFDRTKEAMETERASGQTGADAERET